MIPLMEMNEKEFQQQLRNRVWDLMVDNDLTFVTGSKEMRIATSTLYQFISGRRAKARSSTVIRLLRWIKRKEKLLEEKGSQDNV